MNWNWSVSSPPSTKTICHHKNLALVPTTRQLIKWNTKGRRSVFCYLSWRSTAFKKVLHKGLPYKLKPFLLDHHYHFLKSFFTFSYKKWRFILETTPYKKNGPPLYPLCVAPTILYTNTMTFSDDTAMMAMEDLVEKKLTGLRNGALECSL